MKTQFEQMMDGLNDVEAFLAGKQEGFRAHVPQEVDVKAIRNRLGMTQARFADTFGFSLDAIKHWEGGRRTPEAPARTLLTVIDRNPAAVLTALNPAAFAAGLASSNSPAQISCGAPYLCYPKRAGCAPVSSASRKLLNPTPTSR